MGKTKKSQVVTTPSALEINKLTFSFQETPQIPIFKGLSVEVPAFSRCLVLGANGVGKSTLLRILSGKHLIKNGEIRILGQDPFSGDLGPGDVTLVAEKFPFELDIGVSELLSKTPHDAEYGAMLVELLGVDKRWRMHRVSNGQRRRVDLLLSFLRRPKVVLLDEVTSDLDILSRQRLLGWLYEQTKAKKMTVLFATHILDGMTEWASHLLFLSPQKLRCFEELENIPDWKKALKERPHSPLLWISERWLKQDEKAAMELSVSHL